MSVVILFPNKFMCPGTESQDANTGVGRGHAIYRLRRDVGRTDMKGPGNSGGYTPEPFSLEQTPPGGADTQRVPGRAQRAGCSSPGCLNPPSC